MRNLNWFLDSFMDTFSQHKTITYRQKRTIQRIQQHIRNYKDNPYIQLTNKDLREHRHHLNAIITITTEHKVALKAIKVDKVLQRIQTHRSLKRFNDKPNSLPSNH